VNDQHPARYEEAHTALNGRLLAVGALPFATAVVCLVTGLATRQPWFFVFTAWLCVPMMISAGLLYRSWPTSLTGTSCDR
jgi:hypothetical protein